MVMEAKLAKALDVFSRAMAASDRRFREFLADDELTGAGGGEVPWSDSESELEE